MPVRRRRRRLRHRRRGRLGHRRKGRLAHRRRGRRLGQAPLLVPASEGAMSECARACDAERVRTIVLPIPVEPSGPAAGRRDIAAITYAGNPAKKGLDRVLYAWSRARREGEQLVVAGVEEEEALAGAPPGVTVVGRLAPEAYRTLLRR